MPVSKKQAIADDIRARIRSGEYPPEHKLPSNAEMQKLYECSAEPIRSAIEVLKATGWVVGAAGLGVFVSEKPPL